ncbi:uncharacterized protein LOC122389233 [Amphibalanus amphitrite]|uniref:uncharacterized protein LOC122389233 n=1 Tax=Amphibalanus amphitrite TaxID=1232801 RepID=UPI001C8FB828|nr:uncharacterized protein LOC122389233 [Amphibalanus amphitrite]
MVPTVPLLVSLSLLARLPGGAGQLPEEPLPGEEANFCPWHGEWYPPDPSVPIYTSTAKCMVVHCLLQRDVARVNLTFVGGGNAVNCCEHNGELYTQGEIEYHGNCKNLICTEAGWEPYSTLAPLDEVPCPPGSVSVWSGRRRRCVTVLPTTASFSAARAQCRQLGGRLAAPFGGGGRRDTELRTALGPVNGWLEARGGDAPLRWPNRLHPERLWYDDNRVLPADAVGCLGYRFTNSTGGWFEYSCSEELRPICATIPPQSCLVSMCLVGESLREHGSTLSQPAPCLTVRCWYGHRQLEQDPTCCALTIQTEGNPEMRLLPPGNHVVGQQICTCQSAELSCVEQLSDCTQ